MQVWSATNIPAINIREEQIQANKKSLTECFLKKQPCWVCGDSRFANDIAPGEYDMIFSCPPYFDLEKYSDNPADISNMSYEDFLKCYREIIYESVSMLKKNRFAVFVVGDVRNQKTGMYRNFVSETIAAFNIAGLHLYNEIILIHAIGSLPVRISNNFQNMRKVGKLHQNILVFYKGENQKELKSVFGDVEISEIE